MNELVLIVTDIQSKINEFSANADKHLNGNKAAGARARKASIELGKLFKEYRKISVEASK